MKEDEAQVSVTVDAGTRIEGDGNVVVFDGRKDRGGGNVNGNSSAWKGGVGEGGEMARKRRASSVSSCHDCLSVSLGCGKGMADGGNRSRWM